MVQGLIANYGGMVAKGAEDAGDARITAAARGWGLMARADYRRAIDLCLRRDLRPRFAKLGIRLND